MVLASFRVSESQEDDMSNRVEFTDQLKKHLDEVNANLDRWQSQANATTQGARQRYDDQMRQLRRQRDQTAQKLADLEAVSDEAASGMQDGVQAAWTSLRDAFGKAKSALK